MPEGHKSDFAGVRKAAHSLDLPGDDLGQLSPRHYPHRRGSGERPEDPLGDPLTIHEVARLIGCSLWTVRHRSIPRGLPHLRIAPKGKLIFYRQQVIRWILENQKKGGRP
ncbi:MAG: hypothetical protein KGJ86_00315 [Chloroflexota bacterium]|nr:hypothetical protein [Chloroflexota bacterium]